MLTILQHYLQVATINILLDGVPFVHFKVGLVRNETLTTHIPSEIDEFSKWASSGEYFDMRHA